MPATITTTGHGAQFTFTEWTGANGTGSVVPPTDNITYTSDTPTVATVSATGAVTAVGVGTATISGLDPGTGLSASDVLTVTAGAVSATGVLVANP